MSQLEIRVLGKLQIRENGRSVPDLSAAKTQALFIYLAMNRQPLTRQLLSGLLWGDMPERRARRNLRVALARARDFFDQYLIIERRSLCLAEEIALRLDVFEFEALLAAAAPSMTQLQQAVDLYRGPFLDDFNLREAPLFEEWQRQLRERYRQMAMDALYKLVDHHTYARQYSPAIEYANRLLRLEPWMEEAHRQLMLLLARSGQRSAALAQYETCRDLLAEELGVSPTEATVALYRQIRDEEIEADAAPVQRAQPSWRPPMQAPAASPHFVGRDDEQAALLAALTAADGPAMHALVGMGGVGKSTLAVAVARAAVADFPDGVLWAYAGGSEPMAVLESWAAAYGYDFTRIADLDSMAAAFRGVLASKQALVVLDDVASVSRIRPLLPGDGRCRVLLTTRDRDLARALHAHVWPLTELNPASGLALLAEILEDERVAAEPAAAREICALLHQLPLAVEITAQRLKSRPRRRLHDMAHRLRDETQRLSLLTISDRAVRASFQVSWSSLDAERRRIFALIGVFNGRSFTAEALAHMAGISRYATEDRLFDLINLSLLREDATYRYRQHPLLADFAREQLADDRVGETAVTQFVDYFLNYARDHAAAYDALRPEWENLSAALTAAHTHGQWQTLIALAAALREAWFRRGRFSQARQAYPLVYQATEALGDKRQMAETRLWWGKAAVEQYDHAAALAQFEQGLALFTQLEDAAGIAFCHCEMARVALEQSRFDEAASLLEVSRRIRQELADNKGIAETFYIEARAAYFQGNYETAVALGQQALSLQEQLGDTSGLIHTLSLMASTHIQRSELEQAAQLAQQAKAQCEASENASDLAIILDVLADILRRQGQLDQAEAYAQESLELVQRFGDLGSQAQVMYQLSRIAYAKAMYEDALSYGLKSLEQAQQLAYELLAAAVLNHLGRVYLARKQIAEARHHWMDALQISERLQHDLLINQVQQRLNALAD